MEKWKIWSIIGIMSFALIGVAMSQIYWIKWSISLDEKNFDTRVFTALNEVKQKIENDINSPSFIASVIENKDPDSIGYFEYIENNNSQWRKSQIIKETKSLEYSLNPELFLHNIESEKIDEYLKNSLHKQGINLDYYYGIYSNNNKEFIVVKDNISEKENSNVEFNKNNLSNSKYKISLLSTEFKSPGSLSLLFNEWIWSNILPTLLLNLIFTILILFVFSYTVYIIFKQKKISQMKTDFVNNMTHEFKTPIATISLATDSILSPVVFNDKEKIRRFINIIQEENSRLLNQVENVLQIAKLDKRKIELSLSEVDVHEILDETIAHLELKLNDKGGEIYKKYNAVDPIIEADETHILNIFSNLIENSIKYSIDKALITINTRSIKGGVEVSIEDKGIGMSKEELNHIFDKFYRVSTGNVHNIKGFGLGLAYVKTFVEAHKAKIKVRSIKGRGSQFIIRFQKYVTK